MANNIPDDSGTVDEAIAPLVNALDSLEDTENAKTLCSSCSTSSRVLHVSEFKRGQHISMPGENFNFFNKTLRKQVHFYKHHAIVKQVRSTSGTSVKLDLIHFVEQDGNINIFETTAMYDLQKDEIYKTEYKIVKYTPDKIVERAEQIQQGYTTTFKTYCLFTCNCEHFATWCVNGEAESLQIDRCIEFSQGILYHIAKCIGISVDEIGKVLWPAINPMQVIGGVSLVFLTRRIWNTLYYYDSYSKGVLCKRCLNEHIIDLWVSFAEYCTVSALSHLILTCALPFISSGCGIALAVILCAASILLSIQVNTKSLFSTPINMPKKRMQKVSDAKKGDILSYQYYAFTHHAVVVNVEEDVQSPTKGSIQCIHYGLPSSFGIFGTREIIEETVSVDLNKSEYFVVDFSTTLCFPSEKVVLRAKARVREKKWWFDNKSDHFCFWAKVDQRSQTAAEYVPVTWFTYIIEWLAFLMKPLVGAYGHIRDGLALLTKPLACVYGHIKKPLACVCGHIKKPLACVCGHIKDELAIMMRQLRVDCGNIKDELTLPMKQLGIDCGNIKDELTLPMKLLGIDWELMLAEVKNQLVVFCKIVQHTLVQHTLVPLRRLEVLITSGIRWSATHIQDSPVHLMEEIQLGDVVSYSGRSKGIVVAIKPQPGKSGRKFQMTQIKYILWRGVQISYAVDLDQHTLKLSIYHPAQCIPMQERVDRAKAMKNKTGKSWTREGFIFDCILLDSVR